MKKNTIIKKTALAFVLISSLFMSCEVGLGSAVDTEYPGLTITNPPIDAVITGKFAVIGNWSDDGSIDNVKVTFRNIDTNVKYGSYSSSFDVTEKDLYSKGKWRCVIDPTSADYAIPDGNYEVTVAIEDKGEHVTKAIRNFAIDNTPPVIILERPGSVVGSESLDTYGRNMTVAGTTADDHNVRCLEVSIYEDSDCKTLLDTVTLTNIQSTMADLAVANFVEGEENHYSKIYKSTTILSEPAQTRYCRIAAYDNAIKYPLDGSEPSEEDKKGNVTNYYYLNDTLSTEEILTDDCKITDIYHILNGSKTAPAKDFLQNLENCQVDKGAFIINPKNNPTYTVSVKKELKKDGTDFNKEITTDYVQYKGSPLTIEVRTGLDNYGMTNMRPYAIACDAYGNVLPDATPVYLAETSGSESVINYKWNTVLTDEIGLVNNTCYIVCVEGTDSIGNTILPKGTGYGFYFDTRAFVSIESLGITVNSGDDLINNRPIYIPSKNPENTANYSTVTVSGTVLSTSGVPQVKIAVGETEVALVKLSDSQKDPDWDAAYNNGKFKYNFTALFSTSAILPKYMDKEASLIVTIENGSVAKSETKKVFYDCTAPSINNFALNPIANKYDANVETGPVNTNISYLNGTVSFDYEVKNEGNQLAKVLVEVLTKAPGQSSWTSFRENNVYTSDFTEISIPDINTVGIADNSELKTVLSVWDKAGNKAVKENIYTVDQLTDKPVVLPADASKSTLRIANKTDIKNSSKNPDKKNFVDSGSPISLVAYDDDGISKIDIEVETLRATDKKPGSVKEYSFDVTLPSQAGVYNVGIKVTDIMNNVNTYSFVVRVVTLKPIVTVSKNTSYASTSAEATAKQIDSTISVNSDQPDFKLVRKVRINGQEKASYGATFTKNDKSVLGEESPVIKDSIIFSSAKQLESGVYELEYVVIDEAEKEGNAVDTFKIDNAKPSVTSIQVLDPLEKNEEGEYYNRNNYTFKGSANDGTQEWQSGVRKIEYSFDGVNYSVAGGSTDWQVTRDFNSLEKQKNGNTVKGEQGKYTISVRAIDAVGNISAIRKADFWYDNAAPTAEIKEYVDKTSVSHVLSSSSTEANRQFYYGYKFSLKGKAADTNPEALQTVKLIQENVNSAEKVEIDIPVNEIINGTWTVTGLPRKADGSVSDATAADGSYKYTLYVKDACGKETLSLSQTLTVDHKAPEKVVLEWNNVETPSGTENKVLSGTKYDFKATAKDETNGSGIESITYNFYRYDNGSWTVYGTPETVNAADNVQDTLTKLLGTKTVDASADLPEGKYKIEVTAKDKAGNSSDAAEQVFYVDQSSPTVSATQISPVGKAALEANENKVLYTGSYAETFGLASLTVTDITDVNNPSAVAVNRDDENSRWSFEVPYAVDGTADGTKKYKITALDLAGRSSSTEISAVIDTKAPQFDTSKITMPDNVATEKSSFRFAGAKGSVTDGNNSSGLSYIYFIFSDDSVTELNAANINTLTANKGYHFKLLTTDGSWSSTQTFNNYSVFYDSTTKKAKEGKKKLWLKAFDNAGNSSNWVKTTFDYDKAKPTIAETGLKTDGTFQNTKSNLVLSGTASDDNGITTVTARAVCKDDDSKSRALTVTGTTSWSTTIAKGYLADGNYDITFTATDKSGKTASAIRNVIIDATPPEIESVSQEENSATIYNTRTINLIVTPKKDTSEIASISYTTVSSGNGRVSGDWSDLVKQESGANKGKYTGTVTFDRDGNNVVYFRIIDNAENVTGDTSDYKPKTYNVDTTPPANLKVYDDSGNEITAAEIVVPGADMTGKKNLVYYVKAEDAVGGAGVKGIALGRDESVSSGLTTHTVGSIEGTYKIEIPVASQKTGDIYFTASDLLDNKASYSPFSLLVDNAVPEVTLSTPACKTGSTTETDDLNGNITISGSVTDTLGAVNGNNDGKVVSIKLEYSKTGTGSWVTINSDDTIDSGLGNTTESFSVTHAFSSYEKLFNPKLGETTDDTGDVYVRITAEDEAGNKGTATRTIKLNRDSDRPKITFDSVKLDGMTSTAAVWLKGTTVLSGTIEDDDGIESLEIKSVENATDHTVESDWKAVTVRGTAWSYDIQDFYTTNKEENANIPRKIYFRVKDKENGNNFFESKETADIHSIYINGSDKITFGKSGEYTLLNLKVDTLAPAVTVKGIHLGALSDGKTESTDTYSENYGALTLGGDTTRQFYVKFSASDKNGIASKVVKAKFDDIEVTSTTITASTTEEETFIAAFTLDFSDSSAHKAINGKNGNLKISVEVEDEAGNKNPERSKTIAYDFKKPTITIKKPSSTATSSGSLTVSGMLEDNTSNPTLYYALSTSDSVKPGTAVTTWTGKNPADNSNVNQSSTILGKTRPINITPEYKQLISNLTWFLYFDGTTGIDNHDKLLNDIINDFGIASLSEINTGATRFDTIVNLYLWVKAVDANGNTQEICHPVKVDPQGMRPSLTIQSPVNGSKLGGTITVNGTAEPKGENTMKYVYLQIGNGTPQKIDTKGSTSWSTKINGDGSLNGNITLTIWAEDNNGNTSLKETCTITVDADSPVIESVFYRKRAGDAASGNITASKEYSSSAYISGQWFLEVKATDKNGSSNGSISTLQLIDADTGNAVTGAALVVSDQTVDSETKMATRTLQYKLPQNSGVGQKKYTISVSDGVTPATKDITVNYDNTAPVLQTSGNTTYKFSEDIEQENGFYKFGSQVFENPVNRANQSGLDFVAFYFKKGDVIYDVMRHRNTVEVKAGEYVIDENDNLPWKEYTIASKESDSIVLTEALSHIYKGGLVKINGTIYEISEVTEASKEVTINGTLDLDPTITYDYAYFALANVVNNTVQESEPDNPGTDNQKIKDKTKYGYGYYPKANNDDGDLIIEKVTSEGVWEAMINSTNIPDGTVELHYVAFDKAGNCTVGTKIDAKVANNAPRIAGAKIWIDYNGNNKFDEENGEITLYNSDKNNRAKLAKTGTSGTKNVYDPKPSASEKPAGFTALTESYTIGASNDGAFVMKGKTKIVPEIVGGNGSIYYSYTNTSESLKGANSTAFMTGTTDNTIGEVTNPIVLQVGDLVKAGESAKATPDKFTFTFTDSTGSNASDHLTATLEIYAGVNVKASGTPAATIKPFYWNSLLDNSVYIENRSDYDADSTYEDIWEDIKGHIELEKYWKGGTYGEETITAASGYTSGATNGIGDGDPKVSGIIIIEGTAHDDLRIDSLVFTLPGMGSAINGTGHDTDTDFTLTSMDAETGVITGTAWNGTKGIGLELVKNEYKETGHDIEWKLTWDTSKIKTVAALDVVFAVKAVNIGTPAPTAATAGDSDVMSDRSIDGTHKYTYTYGSKKNSDVKTYQMDIVPYITYLETTLTKKMSKHPSVYGRTAAGDYPVYYYTQKFSTGSAEGETYKYVGFNMPGSSNQTVGSSSSSAADSVSVNSIASINNINNNAAPYNKQPNGINNNNLTDDVKVKVWNIDSRAATSSKGALTEAKMHSNGGTLGYAYIHKGERYLMIDGVESDKATSTYKNVEFIYDQNGNFFGTYAETNYENSGDAGHLKLAYKSWGTPDGNGTHKTTLALESMAYGTTSTPKRFAPTKLASSTKSNSLYLMYYDSVYKELKFRAGNGYKTSSDNNANNRKFGNFTNISGTTIEKRDDNTAIIVKNNGADIPTTYYSLAVVSGTATDGSGDVVVAVWVANNKLYYAYSANPLNATPTWTILEVEKLSGYADGICAIAADPNGQIHIAAYSSVATGSLTYTYLKSYSACDSSNKVPEANTVYVDRYGTTGEFLTMDFAIEKSGGNYVPYIGYYANEMPKLAYMTGDGNKNSADDWTPPAGVTGSNGTGDGSFYTSDWEQVILPTTSPMVINNDNNNVNIALTRDTDGTKKTTGGPANNANPVLGYAISYQGLGYLETAQLK